MSRSEVNHLTFFFFIYRFRTWILLPNQKEIMYILVSNVRTKVYRLFFSIFSFPFVLPCLADRGVNRLAGLGDLNSTRTRMIPTVSRVRQVATSTKLSSEFFVTWALVLPALHPTCLIRYVAVLFPARCRQDRDREVMFFLRAPARSR